MIALFAICANAQVPNDVQLSVSTQDGRTHFHLGEAIRLQLRYVATIRGKYSVGGLKLPYRGLDRVKVSCTPSTLPRRESPGIVSASDFLNLGCTASKPKSKPDGACVDCDLISEIGPRAAISELVLNDLVEITRPDTYSCTAADSSVLEQLELAHQRPVTLTSNPVKFIITDDSAWAATALKDVLDQLASEKCTSVNDDRYRCFELAEGLRYLDTPDSLAAIAQLLTGGDKIPPWQQQLWLGLFQSRHQDDVIRLLEMRYTDPDFAVTVENMETLTGIRLRKAFPQAFASTAKAEDYRTPAVFLLQETLRKLGDSLPGKSPLTKAISAKTYETFASQDFCEKEAIIPEAERKRVLKQAFVAGASTRK